MTAGTRRPGVSEARPGDSARGSPGSKFPFGVWWPCRESREGVVGVHLGPGLKALSGLRKWKKTLELELRYKKGEDLPEKSEKFKNCY